MTGGGFSPFPGEEGDTVDSNAQFAGNAAVKGPKWFQLPALTIGLLGVQITWSVEMSYASPYLLSLGLSKSLVAMVFLAGPLSGLIMQPLIGGLADNSKSRFGRRRPWMVGGCLLCTFSVFLLGFTRSFASIFTTLNSHTNDVLTIWLAVLSIFLIDFTINAVMAVDRALLVDTLPASQQPSVNAWAARMGGVGGVVGFFLGAVDLEKNLSFFGDTELKILAVLSVIVLLTTHAITVFNVEERVLLSSRAAKKSFVQELKNFVVEMMDLPWSIRQICFIQFFAWIGWFPVLFYSTTYIGEIYKKTHPLDAISALDPNAVQSWEEEATRLGTRAIFYQALLTLACNIILPFFIFNSADDKESTVKIIKGQNRPWWKVHLASLWAVSHFIFVCCMGATLFSATVGWLTFLLTIVGFSWAITMWAPLSLLGEAILTSPSTGGDDAGSIMLDDTRTRRSSHGLSEEERGLLPALERRRSKEADDDDAHDDDGDSRASSMDGTAHALANGNSIGNLVLGNNHARRSTLDVDLGEPYGEEDALSGGLRSKKGGLSAKAGVILGIHNIFVVIPQFLVTGMSSIIFALFDSGNPVVHPVNASANVTALNSTAEQFMYPRAEDATASAGHNAIGIVFRIGGVSTFVAFVLCWRLARELKRR